MKNRKLLGVLLASLMFMAAGCEKNTSSSDVNSNTSSSEPASGDPSVTDASGDKAGDKNEAGKSEPSVTTPAVTRTDGGAVDVADDIGDDPAETKPAVTTPAEPEETKEHKVDIIDEGDKAIEGGDSDGMAEIIEAALSEDKNSGYDSPDISGTWTENGKEANNISIEKVEGNVYKATIIKNYEHSSGALWELVLRYEDGKFVYSSAKKHTFSYASGSLESTEVYSDGTGSLVLEDGHLTWTDDKEDQGNGLVFSKE